MRIESSGYPRVRLLINGIVQVISFLKTIPFKYAIKLRAAFTLPNPEQFATAGSKKQFKCPVQENVPQWKDLQCYISALCKCRF